MPATTEGWRNCFANVLSLLPGCVDMVDATSLTDLMGWEAFVIYAQQKDLEN